MLLLLLQVQELVNRCAVTEKRDAERREAEERKHTEEVRGPMRGRQAHTHARSHARLITVTLRGRRTRW